MQGKKDGCKEWPVEGESLFTYKGKPVPCMPFHYQHPITILEADPERIQRNREYAGFTKAV